MQSVNPKNEVVLAEFEPASNKAIEEILVNSERASKSYRLSSYEDRAACLRQLADLLDSDRHRWSRLLTDEMGKPIAAALAEVEKCASVCRYYADNGESMLAEESLPSDGEDCSIINQPLGPVLAVMPWNFPFWQVLRFAVPAVMAGNVVLLKHASNVPQAALALETLFENAGFDKGVFQVLLIDAGTVERIIADRRVKGVTVTGSVKAGSSVAAIAGRHVKKCVLELGGSDPFIVMPSADLSAAVDSALTARIQNNGQTCIAAKRFIVHSEICEEFTERLVSGFEGLHVGDPLDSATDVGPMALQRVRSRLVNQTQALIDGGARKIVGARPLDGQGFFYEPGVIAGVGSQPAPFDEELFGPVAWLREAAGIEEALRIANETQYGLGSSIWTQEPADVEAASAQIDAGSTFVNSVVKSDPRWPFGGVGRSGHGRELAREGILEFVNRKTIVINATP